MESDFDCFNPTYGNMQGEYQNQARIEQALIYAAVEFVSWSINIKCKF